MTRKTLYTLLALLFLGSSIMKAQEVYQHITSKSIYSFLDEMANLRLIELNSAVKPYSRRFIAEKLEEIQDTAMGLNKRQLFELTFFLKDYNKELMPDKNFKKRFDILYYKDSLFTLSVNPILGIQYWNNSNRNNYHRWNGADIFSYVGNHLGIYASLRDNHEDKPLSNPQYLTTRQAAKYKSGYDFSEMRGGITWSWHWGSIGLVKDHFEWGNYYNYPSIFSAKPPSITHLKLHLKPVKWLEFNYIHGWLASGVVDSLLTYSYTNSYGTGERTVYRKKFIAANLFTFKPFENLFLSVGNSVIYSDMNVQPAYLIPFFFYKSVDHTLNEAGENSGGQNSQFFFDISSRQIKHLHMYLTCFFDDIAFYRFKENKHFDYYSFKAGFRVSDLIPNVYFTTEYFKSYPLVYKHDMPTTTFESNFYNLGHYLQDNSLEYYFDVGYNPFRTLQLKIWFDIAKHGPDHTSLGTNRIDVVNMFMDTVKWQNNTLGFSASWQVINDVFLFAEVVHSDITGEMEKYTPPFYYGKNTTFSIGMNFGF